MAWCLIKHGIRLHGVVLNQTRIRLHGVVLNQTRIHLHGVVLNQTGDMSSWRGA
jgi:hypothetical protein